jgi:hypothetical protein
LTTSREIHQCKGAPHKLPPPSIHSCLCASLDLKLKLPKTSGPKCLHEGHSLAPGRAADWCGTSELASLWGTGDEQRVVEWTPARQLRASVAQGGGKGGAAGGCPWLEALLSIIQPNRLLALPPLSCMRGSLHGTYIRIRDGPCWAEPRQPPLPRRHANHDRASVTRLYAFWPPNRRCESPGLSSGFGPWTS